MAALHGLRLGKFDGRLALTTPPFIGEIGVALKQLRGTRLTLWAMDLWPQVAEAVGTLRSGGCLSLALTALARRMYKRADAIISLGQFMSQRLVALGVSEEKIITVHNWVPSEAVTPQPSGQKFLEAYGPFDGRFVIMYSGNMGMPHEFETILAAADLLKNEPALAFVFVGDGKRRQEVVQETRRRGLSNVAFMAPVPLERLSSLLGAAHVHLVSLRPGLEGFVVPSKVYGILAAARPAIMVGSTQNEVAQLLLDAGAGFVVRSGQAEELAEAIRTLHAHPDLASKMGQAGRRYYGEHLGRDRSVSAIMKAVTHSPCPRRQEGRTT
jgi:glycosyltransferase involved in cell wall biosynthesis